MPVFISHRTADDSTARAIYYRLAEHHGIRCYIDDVDAHLQRSNEKELTHRLVQKINECTNLLAIMTRNTTGSWWVPFEVGVARQAPRAITSYATVPDSGLPEYLLEWPRLRGNDAIDTFARLYKAQQRTFNEVVLRKAYGEERQFSTVDSFERQLKASLGQ